MATEPKADRPFMPGYGISEASEGILPWSWAEERLSNSRNYYLATTRRDGRPLVMAVWGVWFGGRFFFHTGGNSQKARNLQANADCVVTTEGASEPVILEGRAKLATGKAVLQRFSRVYKEKYDWEPDPAIGDAWVVQPAKVLAFIEAASDFGTAATRWTFG
jgi:nitroimidazol reductase NimA-like FMN-containing flavoprotein (pyridoxamine 5'-phosphate oxidase superfamily)